MRRLTGMLNLLRKFGRLPADSKWLIAQSVLILATTSAALRLIGLQRLLEIIQRMSKPPKEVEHSQKEIDVYASLFSAVARRWPLPLKCLGRSVALCWLLRARGIDAAVHIGVRKDDAALDAHAWVQIGELVINETDGVADRYTRVMPNHSRANG